MPLIILGLLLIISIVIYSLVKYMNSGEEDPRSVRERYPMAFPARGRNDSSGGEPGDDEPEEIHAEGYVDIDSFRGDIDHIIRNLKETITDKAREHGIDTDMLKDLNPFSPKDEGGGDEDDGGDDDKTIRFPTDNVEEEKHKRNIH